MSNHNPTLVPAASPASRRSVLFGIAAAATPIAPALATSLGGLPAQAADPPTEPDPIFAAIERHREAILAFGPAIDEAEEMEPDEGDAWSGAASEREIEALKVVLTTPPTTLAGVVAVLEHLGQPEWFKEEPREDMRETILSGAIDTAGEEARNFPLLLAETMRSLIAGAQS